MYGDRFVNSSVIAAYHALEVGKPTLYIPMARSDSCPPSGLRLGKTLNGAVLCISDTAAIDHTFLLSRRCPYRRSSFQPLSDSLFPLMKPATSPLPPASLLLLSLMNSSGILLHQRNAISQCLLGVQPLGGTIPADDRPRRVTAVLGLHKRHRRVGCRVSIFYPFLPRNEISKENEMFSRGGA